MDTFFSIIIPTYNSSKYINRCIDSILQQTYSTYEVIVVDNYSTDKTVELIEAYHDSRIRIVREKNHGVIAHSRNVGLELSKGDYICFLDSDDWWLPNKLELCLEYIGKYDLIYHTCYIYRENGSKLGISQLSRAVKLRGNFSESLIVGLNGIVNSSVVLSRKIVEDVGKLDEDYNKIGVEDFDYWIRILRSTNNAIAIRKPLGFYYIAGNTCMSLKQIESLLYIRKQYSDILKGHKKYVFISNIEYAVGRIYQQNFKYSLALKSYLKSILNNMFNFKAYLAFCSSFFKIHI